MNPSISRGGREVNRGMRGPGDLEDVVGVGFERVKFQLEFPDVPERDGLEISAFCTEEDSRYHWTR